MRHVHAAVAKKRANAATVISHARAEAVKRPKNAATRLKSNLAIINRRGY